MKYLLLIIAFSNLTHLALADAGLINGSFEDEFNDNEIFLSFLPLSHVLERMGGHYTAFAIGAKIYYAESIEKVPENLVETHPSIVVCVPRLFEKMYTKIIEGVIDAYEVIAGKKIKSNNRNAA